MIKIAAIFFGAFEGRYGNPKFKKETVEKRRKIIMSKILKYIYVSGFISFTFLISCAVLGR